MAQTQPMNSQPQTQKAQQAQPVQKKSVGNVQPQKAQVQQTSQPQQAQPVQQQTQSTAPMVQQSSGIFQDANLFKKWWFWVAVGVVVLGGAYLIFF